MHGQLLNYNKPHVHERPHDQPVERCSERNGGIGGSGEKPITIIHVKWNRLYKFKMNWLVASFFVVVARVARWIRGERHIIIHQFHFSPFFALAVLSPAFLTMHCIYWLPYEVFNDRKHRDISSVAAAAAAVVVVVVASKNYLLGDIVKFISSYYNNSTNNVMMSDRECNERSQISHLTLYCTIRNNHVQFVIFACQ